MRGRTRVLRVVFRRVVWVGSLALLPLLLMAAAPELAQARGGHRDGHGYHGKRSHHGGHHRGHHHGYRYYGPRYSVYLGGWYAPWYRSYVYAHPYVYGHPHPHVYPYPYPRETTVILEDRVYVERPRAEAPPEPPREAYWHYCESEDGFYPDVESCPEGWIQVPPRPE